MEISVNMNSSSQVSTTSEKYESACFTVKYGMKLWSTSSLRSGIVIDIEHSEGNSLEETKITIDKGEPYGHETMMLMHFTNDPEVIIELMRQERQELQDAYFRLQKVMRQK